MTDAVRIANEDLAVTVSPLGAETQSLKTADGRDWLWDGDPEFWTGRAPILFPIVGKAPEDRVEIDGKTFAMKQHGFARKSLFTLEEQTATLCRFVLTDTHETRQSYPFAFRLAIEHVLEGKTLTVSATVENRNERPMPFGFGFHPAFCWPMPGMDKGHVHHISLANRNEPAMIRLRDGLLDLAPLPSPFSEGILALDHDYFEDDAMIFPEGAGDRLTFSAEDGPALHFAFEGLPNLALWTKPGAPYICVEPWHGMAAANGKGGALEARPFTKILPPGESTCFSWSVEIDA
ncbi:aldose 1-epimerase family protein [Martelella lutilitoris]|uniref:Aldose 1-epimerase family protein n=1 Tax=Martelella lutilitoris TaxID=2583532 RepID=A0A5C4JQG0_9HYPH|nr:aldose 1-epimerase family protein [Martelella lutilitoris]TNB47568.1 aldose 1-epimerase family protein [Martelella lutilitoris]